MKEQLVFIDNMKLKLSNEINVLGYERCICKVCRTVFTYTNYHCPILFPCGHSFGACCITAPIFYCNLHEAHMDLRGHTFQHHINIELVEFVNDFMRAYTFGKNSKIKYTLTFKTYLICH
ncbi:hypothetical protein Bpfe_018129 [Biomphalaria pfeifferi]|uniref:RING-type domain-containing protein n=1 Tax=Biomphalaria pfeifferi TaxID=112525 RepID=A0AAD8BFK1_BIOPF|nr:hypothetical protein Bpfe_018129 [Biomphalaria pfeifferi]